VRVAREEGRLPRARVVQMLDGIAQEWGYPEAIQVDNERRGATGVLLFSRFAEITTDNLSQRQIRSTAHPTYAVELILPVPLSSLQLHPLRHLGNRKESGIISIVLWKLQYQFKRQKQLML